MLLNVTLIHYYYFVPLKGVEPSRDRFLRPLAVPNCIIHSGILRGFLTTSKSLSFPNYSVTLRKNDQFFRLNE